MFFLLLAIGFLFGTAGNVLVLPFSRGDHNQRLAILFGAIFYTTISLLWLGSNPGLQGYPIENLVLASGLGWGVAGIILHVVIKFLRKNFPDQPQTLTPPSSYL